MMSEGEAIRAAWADYAWETRPTIIQTQFDMGRHETVLKLSDGTTRRVSALAPPREILRARVGLRVDPA